MFLFDSAYIWMVFLPSLLLSLGAQLWVQQQYTRWQRTRNTSGLTGAQAGVRLVQSGSLSDVRFEGVEGQLTDHYDPSGHVVRLSRDIATQPSVASLAIVAHELGHAQQHEQRSLFIQMRSFLVPAMRFSPMAAYGLIILGLMMNVAGLAWLGVVFFGITVVFMLLTLPVEFDASRRGMILLQKSGFMTQEELSGARQMLTAAALTYVAAFVTSLLTLLYYVSLISRND